MRIYVMLHKAVCLFLRNKTQPDIKTVCQILFENGEVKSANNLYFSIVYLGSSFYLYSINKNVIYFFQHVIRCLWHPKLNQMFVGCGDGAVKVYYDPEKSMRGAKLCIVKTKRKMKQVDCSIYTLNVS